LQTWGGFPIIIIIIIIIIIMFFSLAKIFFNLCVMSVEVLTEGLIFCINYIVIVCRFGAV